MTKSTNLDDSDPTDTRATEIYVNINKNLFIIHTYQVLSFHVFLRTTFNSQQKSKHTR